MRGEMPPTRFRAALTSVPPLARDTWVDLVLGIEAVPDDGPGLPRGCVPYLPCAVDALLRAADLASVGASDRFVDVGSGAGRAAALMHLLTGAEAVGLEIQPELVAAARDLSARLGLSGVSFAEGDAPALTAALASGSVFFLYCPFSGERLVKLLAVLEQVARTRAIHVCCLDLPLPACAWLEPAAAPAADLAVYRSVADR